ncbi:MAG: ABC transporter substrate-binding protein [Armatimonadota bacterium]|nr:ABC transporter substrate-binding protein [Armatimonadota bacterium]MDR7533788.1 ABC transporter substrate-binding protein [Armatimonadota bacterium]MDR7535778.1 ABC transporter substrate-binding protein [Armatimonadota bacterium]
MRASRVGHARLSLLAVLVVVAAVMLSAPALAPALGAPVRGGRLVVGKPLDPDGYDPHRVTAINAAYVISLIYDTLLHLDYDLKTITPGLARSWDVSRDGLTYTFELRNDVRFHSGRRFTSADVKYTFERLLEPRTASPHRFRLGAVERIETPSETTVVLRLREPQTDLLLQLTIPFLGIIDREAVERFGDRYGSAGAGGTGPFVFVEWVPNDRTVLRRNDAYRWGPQYYRNRGPAHVDEVVYRTIPETQTLIFELERGNVHSGFGVRPPDIDVLRRNRDVQILEAKPYQHIQYLSFKITRPNLGDVRVRKAISAAINKAELVKDVQRGQGAVAHGIVQPSTLDYWAGQEQVFPRYDPGQARALLEEAGWRPGPDGIRTRDGQRLQLQFFGISASQEELATLLQAHLKAVGIDMQIRLVTLSAYFPGLRNQDYDVWSLDYPYASILEMLNLYFWSGNIPSPNRVMWDDRRTDGLLLVARRARTDEQRVRAVHDLQKVVAENHLWVPLWHRVLLVPTRVEVRGFRPHGVYGQAYYKLLDVWLERR